MNGTFFGAIFGSNFGAIFGSNDGGYSLCARADDMQYWTAHEKAKWRARAIGDRNLDSTLFRSKPPGIYWTRTSGRTHRVEIVR